MVDFIVLGKSKNVVAAAIRPSSWRQLLSDSGERGRLLRAVAFDLYTLGGLARDLPAMAWRYASTRAAALVRPVNTFKKSPEVYEPYTESAEQQA